MTSQMAIRAVEEAGVHCCSAHLPALPAVRACTGSTYISAFGLHMTAHVSSSMGLMCSPAAVGDTAA